MYTQLDSECTNLLTQTKNNAKLHEIWEKAASSIFKIMPKSTRSGKRQHPPNQVGLKVHVGPVQRYYRKQGWTSSAN